MQTDHSVLSWLAAEPDRAKLRLPGTDRARPPAETLAMAAAAAVKVGVTRVADITRLDTIGIPTYQAIRPTARTLALSQGKGVTAELAKLSAIMEAVESWHVEQPLVPDVAAAPPRELAGELGYDVAALAACEPSLLHDGLPLDWVEARSLLDGARTLVPVDAVRLTLERRTGWNAPAFLASTNGLASGNTLVEATLHALYEIIERDAVAAVLGDGLGVLADPRSLGSPVVDGLCERIEAAHAYLEVRFVPSPTGLPCFLAWVACHDYQAAMFGFGCHLSPEIALSRAVTEAVQTRLAYISGARDDLEDDIDADAARRPRSPGPVADLRDLAPRPPQHDSLLGDLEYVVKQATAAFSFPPLVADLTRPQIGVPVVKVVAPGSRVSPEVL
jgi:ribosomal protein S12 methylthiotransferase accessory factor